MQIRRMQTGEEERLKEIRLRSLLDDPGAFGSSYDAEVVLPDEHWQRLLSAETDAIFAAEDGDRWVGLTGVGVDWNDSTYSHIWGMWVESSARGAGVGAALLDAAVAWARARGGRGVRLWVAESNPGAERLYSSRGFERSGVTKPHPPDPRVTEFDMELLF